MCGRRRANALSRLLIAGYRIDGRASLVSNDLTPPMYESAYAVVAAAATEYLFRSNRPSEKENTPSPKLVGNLSHSATCFPISAAENPYTESKFCQLP